MMTFRDLQERVRAWSLHNFGEQPTHRQVLGAAEEVGELCHAQLKLEQGNRINEDHVEEAKDAVADTIIFLADYTGAQGWDLQEIIERVWSEVEERDWKRWPETGRPPSGSDYEGGHE